jgi:hypothetical protein
MALNEISLQTFDYPDAARKIIDIANTSAQELGMGDNYSFKIMEKTREKTYFSDLGADDFKSNLGLGINVPQGNETTTNVIESYGLYYQYGESDPELLMQFSTPGSIRRTAKSNSLKEDMIAIISDKFSNGMGSR